MEDPLRIENLVIGYHRGGKQTIVASGLNASLRGGSLTCLLGSNGVGKSTLLRTIASFIPCFSGSIHILEKETSKYTPEEFSRLLGMVLTERLYVENMTVRELVGYGRFPYTGFWGRLSKKDLLLVDEAMEQVGIVDLAQRVIGELSDGERQKAMIAKVLAQKTPIIVLDEPTAFLDYPSKVDIMDLLLRISRETNRTILLTTHDVNMALETADIIWLMSKNGGIVAGTPEDLTLNGCLKTFFSCSSIVFNESRGTYNIHRKCIGEVCLIGLPSTRMSMAKKAFNRLGVSIEPNVQPEVTVEILQNGFIVTVKGNKISCHSIDEMLRQAIPYISNKA